MCLGSWDGNAPLLKAPLESIHHNGTFSHMATLGSLKLYRVIYAYQNNGGHQPDKQLVNSLGVNPFVDHSSRNATQKSAQYHQDQRSNADFRYRSCEGRYQKTGHLRKHNIV